MDDNFFRMGFREEKDHNPLECHKTKTKHWLLLTEKYLHLVAIAMDSEGILGNIS